MAGSNIKKDKNCAANLITLVTKGYSTYTTLLPYKKVKMKVEYNNLYTYFILITQDRLPLIAEKRTGKE
jgi:hypothetical protein